MKLFYTTMGDDDVLYFAKAESMEKAHDLYVGGFSDSERSKHKDDILVEVTDLETLIDLLPEEFQASEEF